jgi:hypothetical protein
MLVGMAARIPVNVFVWTDSLCHSAFPICSDMFTQWQLDKNSTRLFIIVKFLDSLYDFLDGNFSREADVLEFDPDFLGGLGFHTDIHA